MFEWDWKFKIGLKECNANYLLRLFDIFQSNELTVPTFTFKALRNDLKSIPNPNLAQHYE